MVDETRHEEIRRLLTRKTPEAMVATLPCYSIPFARNEKFFGRVSELQQCRDALNPTLCPNCSKGIALYGNGGVGKTSIALELAHFETSRRKAILWLAADEENKLADSFVQAALDLGLHEENADKKTDRDAVKNWLEKTGKCITPVNMSVKANCVDNLCSGAVALGF